MATGDSLFNIAASYRVGLSTLRSVIQETCSVMIKVLAPDYLKVPTEEKWISISKGFNDIWNLPNCLGAVDGKHITIKAPPNSGSLFYNYKKTFSTVLMAVCDHEYKFTVVDVGSYGYASDSGIFTDTLLSEGLYNGPLIFKVPNTEFEYWNSTVFGW